MSFEPVYFGKDLPADTQREIQRVLEIQKKVVQRGIEKSRLGDYDGAQRCVDRAKSLGRKLAVLRTPTML